MGVGWSARAQRPVRSHTGAYAPAMRVWVLLRGGRDGQRVRASRPGSPGDAPTASARSPRSDGTGPTSDRAARPTATGTACPTRADNCPSPSPNRNQANADGAALGNACRRGGRQRRDQRRRRGLRCTPPRSTPTPTTTGSRTPPRSGRRHQPARRDTDRDGLPDGARRSAIRRSGAAAHDRRRFRADLDPRTPHRARCAATPTATACLTAGEDATATAAAERRRDRSRAAATPTATRSRTAPTASPSIRAPVSDCRASSRCAAASSTSSVARGRAGRARYAFTAPSPHRYPWQWYWDSCFIAIVRCALGRRARAAPSWNRCSPRSEDGFIGHIIFWGRPLNLERLVRYNVARRGAT